MNTVGSSVSGSTNSVERRQRMKSHMLSFRARHRRIRKTSFFMRHQSFDLFSTKQDAATFLSILVTKRLPDLCLPFRFILINLVFSMN